MIFGGASLRSALHPAAAGVAAVAVGVALRYAARAREYPARNSCNICAVDSGFAVDDGAYRPLGQILQPCS